MIKSATSKVRAYFIEGDERTLKARKNIIQSFILKGFSIAIGLILIPMTITYVNPVQYGVWLTLSSIITWFNFFDVGLGNGLKNKLAEANALNQQENSKIYISTTYAVLTVISLVVFLLFLVTNTFIDWSKILNVSQNLKNELNTLALIFVAMFCIQFVLQILFNVLTAYHLPAKVSLIALIGQAASLGIIFYLSRRGAQGDLNTLVLILAGIPLIVLLGASLWFYKFDFKLISPSFKYIKLKYAKSLLSLGGVFFVIQIGGLILFQTDNFIITQLFGPEKVTDFNIAYKLFSTVILGFTIIMTPYWSAFTDAYARKDFEWIQTTFKKIYKIWFMIIAGCIVLFFISPYIYKIWIGDSVHISNSLSLAMCFYAIGFTWLMIHCFLLNGIGKLMIQLYLYLIAIIVNIPLAIFLGRHFGVPGVTLANIIVFVFMGLVLFVQCQKLINQKATGLWNT